MNQADITPARFDLQRIFNPASVAIVGASANENSVSGQPLRYLQAFQFPGRLYPVNPKYDELRGLQCYRSVADLPEVPDVALIAVAAERVEEAVRHCGARGIRGVIVLSSGFAETGESGSAAQTRLAQLAAQHRMTLIGPNCQGMMNIADGIRLGFGAPFGIPYRKGRVSLVSQSGAFGNAVLMLAEENGIGFRKYLSIGNESVVSTLDVIDHLLEDPETDVIAAYVEGFRDAYRLIDLGRRAAGLDKPLLMWKVGNSQAGARAAASHTANLCGSPVLYRTAFRQAGIVEVSDVDELADCAKGLLSGARPEGRAVAVITLSGGAGIAMADRCDELGLATPEFAPETVAMLEPFVPQFATVQNPLDLTAGFGQDTERFGRIVRLVAEDPAVEVIAIALAATSGKVAEQFAACLAGLKSTLPVPLFVAWNARAADVGQAYDILEEAGIPRFCTPARCARAIEAAATFAATQRRFRMAAAAPTRAIAPASARPRQTIRTLSEFEAKGLLQTARIPITIETLACSREEAILAAATLNGPAVMKIQSPDLPHKTEIGGVRMGVQGSEKVGFAYEELVGSARLHAPRARIDGVLIQEYVSGAAELIVGTSFSNEFGASILVGMGGIYSEVLNDVAVRLLPVDRQEVLSMLQETKVFRILQGVRGQPAADVDALVDVILRVADLALELGGSLDSLEINPLFVRARGKGVVAGDALASLYEDDRTVKRQVIAA